MYKKLPCIVWLTGQPCSGKTTIAKELLNRLRSSGAQASHLDGDEIRKTINSDLTFVKDSVTENHRRVAEICKLLMPHTSVIICSFVSPHSSDRQMVRNMVGTEHFIEVAVGCSPDECENRDVKGMYKEARAGLRKGFVGVDAPYETPENAEVYLNTTYDSVSQTIEKLERALDSLIRM